VVDSASHLLDAVRRLNESLDPSRVLVRVCEEAARLLEADSAGVFLGGGADGVRARATYGQPAERIGEAVELGEGLVGEVLERGEARLVEGGLAVPLRWDGRLRGALAVGYERERDAGREELALLEAFGDLAAAACRNASAHAELALAARTDTLTGCLNHAAMHDALHREFERCRRKGHALSLVIVDLDEFKQVNELHGHLAGDAVLRQVGESLRQSVRAYDLVARYGGDEFAVIAIDADEATATEVALRALEAIGRALGALGSAGQATAATAGVAEWEAGDSPTALIARADRALLHGKHSGLRGTAVHASSLPGAVAGGGAGSGGC
jgi:diguanylate cyclase (GGDEF)-like protein